MNNCIEIYALAEGPSDKMFLSKLIVPHLAAKGIYMYPTIISKPGENGGDVKFSRAKNDIEQYLKQRSNTYLTTFLDFYGLKEWPGMGEARERNTPKEKAQKLNTATREKVKKLFADYNVDNRFIPYVSMHELEALLFSDPQKLAVRLGVRQNEVNKIIAECGEPENINDSPATSPSNRLKSLSRLFRKTSTGISIAEEIGLNVIRAKCPIFNSWLNIIESLK